LAADRDDGIHLGLGHHLTHALDAAVLEGVGARGAEDRAALLRDAHDLRAPEGIHVGLDEALPAVLDADELDVVVLGQTLEHGPADDRVEPGTVATAGEDSDLHPLIMPCFDGPACRGSAPALGRVPRDRVFPVATTITRSLMTDPNVPAAPTPPPAAAPAAAPGDYPGKTLG